METPLYLFRHALYFGVTLALPLLLLAHGTRIVAARRGLEWTPLVFKSALRTLGIIAGIGITGQLTFYGIHLIAPHAVQTVRLTALAAAAAATALAVAPVIPYFSRWKGVLFGLLSALPATYFYHYFAPVQEWTARAAVAAVVTACLALAITLPIPVEERVSKEETAGDNTGFVPNNAPVTPSRLICPDIFLIQPSQAIVGEARRRKRRR